MATMTIGTRVQCLDSQELGTVIKAKTEWNGMENETAYLVTWDLDDECDEPGWRWSPELAPVA